MKNITDILECKPIGRYRIVFIICIAVFASCAESVPQDLSQAYSVIRYLARPDHLKKSMFLAAFPEGRPSQFVSYIFSEVGSAEWPPSEEWALPAEAESLRMTRTPLMPAGVRFAALKPDLNSERQVVVKFDDKKGVVIVEGYLTPAAKPVFIKEFALPKVEPDPMAKVFYQSNIEMGASPASFKTE